MHSIQNLLGKTIVNHFEKEIIKVILKDPRANFLDGKNLLDYNRLESAIKEPHQFRLANLFFRSFWRDVV